MTLREYAEKLGIQYRTAWNHFKRGKIKGAYNHPTGM
jgi:predicted site-specific integrase-resolvase